MNGSRARAIRKSVYGKEAQDKPGFFRRLFRQAVSYRGIQHIKQVFGFDGHGEYLRDKDGKRVKLDKVTLQIRCSGLREKYLKAKQAYKEEMCRPFGSH